ncbi:hypothetical protein [Alkalihalobacillus sp. R86527]|uniref:hypothetical protein n=1 Tax=Alkalihalobacillus sp. R86527 TaxID=3093863 RepID=UPI00366BED91
MQKLVGVLLGVMVLVNVVLMITVINLTYQAEEMIIELKAVEVQLEDIDDALNQMMIEDK